MRRTLITPTPRTHWHWPTSVPGKLSNIPCQASHDVLANVVGTFGNVAAETQTRMSVTPLPELAAITFVHSGRPRVIRLPVSRRPSSRRGLGENFGSKVIGPLLCSSNRDRQRLACGRSLLSQPRHAPGLLFYSVHIGAGGKKQESHWAWQPQRLVSPDAG